MRGSQCNYFNERKKKKKENRTSFNFSVRPEAFIQSYKKINHRFTFAIKAFLELENRESDSSGSRKSNFANFSRLSSLAISIADVP